MTDHDFPAAVEELRKWQTVLGVDDLTQRLRQEAKSREIPPDMVVHPAIVGSLFKFDHDPDIVRDQLHVAGEVVDRTLAIDSAIGVFAAVADDLQESSLSGLSAATPSTTSYQDFVKMIARNGVEQNGEKPAFVANHTVVDTERVDGETVTLLIGCEEYVDDPATDTRL